MERTFIKELLLPVACLSARPSAFLAYQNQALSQGSLARGAAQDDWMALSVGSAGLNHLAARWCHRLGIDHSAPVVAVTRSDRIVVTGALVLFLLSRFPHESRLRRQGRGNGEGV